MIKQLKIVREFRRSLRSLERIIASRISTETSCCGVTLSQCHLLLELEQTPGISLNELSRQLDLDKSTLSRTVESLVQDGLVTRIIPDNNRRSVKISLSEKGREKTEYINKICDDFYSSILKNIPEEEHSSVIEAMRLIEKASKSISGISLIKQIKAKKNE